jgi:hypothetical protein
VSARRRRPGRRSGSCSGIELRPSGL